MKKKILFILPTLHAGGAENYALRFIRFCGNAQYEWHVLSPNLKKGDLHEEFEAAGCTIYYQSIGYFHLVKAWSLYKLFKEERFDTIANFNGNFSGLSLLIGKLAGIPKRMAWHRRSTDAFGNNPLKKFYNRFSNQLVRWNATHILSNSQFALDNFYGNYQINDKRFLVIPNGIDASMFDIPQSKEEARQVLGLPQGVLIIGHVGRFDPAKNHETIFKVIAALKERGNQFLFLFCGKGTNSPAFKNRVAFHKIEKNVIALGLSNKVPLVYRSLDLFYFPSITEGQPNALIEAMLSRVPFVASNIPPIKESIPDNLKSFLVDSFDVEGSVKAIEAFQIRKNEEEVKSTQKWAIDYFSPNLRFKEFRNCI